MEVDNRRRVSIVPPPSSRCDSQKALNAFIVPNTVAVRGPLAVADARRGGSIVHGATFPMRNRLNLTLPVEIVARISELSKRKKISRSAIVEAAVASFLSPDATDRREAAFARRMDRVSRQAQRIERDLGITAETLALFVRFWLTITPPLPADASRCPDQGEGAIRGLRRNSRRPAAEGAESPEGNSRGCCSSGRWQSRVTIAPGLVWPIAAIAKVYSGWVL